MIRSTDLFLNTANPSLVKSELQAYGVELDGTAGVNENIVVDWIGKIPATLDPVTGAVLTWQAGEFFNIRIQDDPEEPNTSILSDIQAMSGVTLLPTPTTPYRVFS